MFTFFSFWNKFCVQILFSAILKNRLQKKDPRLFEAIFSGDAKENISLTYHFFFFALIKNNFTCIFFKFLFNFFVVFLLEYILCSKKFFIRFWKIDLEKRIPVFSMLYFLRVRTCLNFKIHVIRCSNKIFLESEKSASKNEPPSFRGYIFWWYKKKK